MSEVFSGTQRSKVGILLLLICSLLTACVSENNAISAMNEGDAALGNKILIAYYSPNGQVREMAETIRNYVGGDIQEIKSVEVYPDNLDDFREAIVEEQSEGTIPEIMLDIENLDSYDTILLGSPVWYGNVPMTIPAFLKAYDLSDKRIIPFVIDEDINLIEVQENLAEYYEGTNLEEFYSVSSEEQIAPWLKQVGIFSELIQISVGNDVYYGGLYQNKEACEFAELLPIQVSLYVPADFARAFNLDMESALSDGAYRTRSYEIGKIAYWPEGPAIAIFVDDSEPQTVVPVIHLGQIFFGAPGLAECEEIVIEKLEF